jgi:hypothetical protein
LVVAADADRAVGEHDAAAALTAQALGLARRWGTPGSIGQTLHATARRGAGEDTVEVLRDAISTSSAHPHVSSWPAR